MKQVNVFAAVTHDEELWVAFPKRYKDVFNDDGVLTSGGTSVSGREAIFFKTSALGSYKEAVGGVCSRPLLEVGGSQTSIDCYKTSVRVHLFLFTYHRSTGHPHR